MQQEIGIVIGRMNPPHIGHLYLIEEALSRSDYVIIVFGSADQPPTPKNPFSVGERNVLLMQMCKDRNLDTSRLILTYARDFLYSDIEWINSVKRQVNHCVMSNPNIKKNWQYTLYGYEKDESSEYLRWFRDFWKYHQIDKPYVDSQGTIVSSTRIREAMFSTGMFSLTTNLLTETYSDSMLQWFEQWMNTQSFHQLEQDYEYYKEYKHRWEVSPFPPVFVTGDAVVFCNGHVLVVTRKGPPGRDTFALPGGFINQDETIKDCIIRELKEETRIDVPPGKLKNCMRQVVTFDAPQRSLRGRTITHAGVIVLEEPALPRVRGSDDAKTALWISLHQIERNQHRFFEDHFHIIFSLKTI